MYKSTSSRPTIRYHMYMEFSKTYINILIENAKKSILSKQLLQNNSYYNYLVVLVYYYYFIDLVNHKVKQIPDTLSQIKT